MPAAVITVLEIGMTARMWLVVVLATREYDKKNHISENLRAKQSRHILNIYILTHDISTMPHVVGPQNY